MRFVLLPSSGQFGNCIEYDFDPSMNLKENEIQGMSNEDSRPWNTSSVKPLLPNRRFHNLNLIRNHHRLFQLRAPLQADYTVLMTLLQREMLRNLRGMGKLSNESVRALVSSVLMTLSRISNHVVHVETSLSKKRSAAEYLRRARYHHFGRRA
jgi:hypothetical protein